MKSLSSYLVALLALSACTSQTTTPAKVEADAKSTADAKAGDVKAGDTKANPRRPRGKQVPAPADVGVPPADATKTASGIAYKSISPGTEPGPTENDSVRVQLTAWTADGATVETTDGRKTPKLVRMNRPPVPGLAEALTLMKMGETMRFWIPPELTYKGRKGAPEGVLTYEIQLEEVLRAPEVPADVAAPPADATTTESGLAYKVLQPGTGDKKPRKWDRVQVHYTGWHTDGKMFDSSVTRGRPSTFPVDRVVPGWTEGLQMMVVGEKTRFWVPENLAYAGAPGKPAGMLVFDVELISIDEQPEPPPPPEVPADVAGPPADATKTASGLAYKVLEKGTGTAHPEPTSVVEVHYSGWTTDGKMFDSSVTRGKPTSFPLNRVIKGWTEGLQLMVEGEKTRFWIPVELAYENKPGKPAGMLVFDVQLLSIKANGGPELPPGHP
ncbi:FKBP-type peptidyl-prolyl cis-trans isomerase [Paraliomyxa miuraensis]|uniref:FKBP-type peptidyl-prolyl cis-trans isomerase n=1 Tax=Paraliomyxa miuraensis TaxID=376150 RepID=UPI00225507F7|nr:FKBP-type peptidyl-prolyl cis-trans isomerase [Paraliomyxa miuraensis]MCX4242727.1 FKBP-type peptidyl-prolyl cis-trans isomerase [Paraliomyxa miuraensis]